MAAVNHTPPGTEYEKNSVVVESDHQRDEEVGSTHQTGKLQRDLKGRHMQMIAIGKFAPSSLPSFPLGFGSC